MVSSPITLAVTTPVDELIAALLLLALHTPPVAASLSAVVKPRHALRMPVIGANGFTVTTTLVVQPAADVPIIVAVPAVTPVTIPVIELTVATAVLPLVKVTPGVASLSDVVKPTHTLGVPSILVGSAFTDTRVVV